MTIRFRNPPVVERAIGVQFKALPFFTDAHAGWFWKSWLTEDWKQINAAPAILDRFEEFGEVKPQVPPIPFLSIQSIPARTQITRAADSELVQLQNTRFHVNWRKQEGQDYLDFSGLIGDFEDLFTRFKDFAKKAGDTTVELNQWEVTYINQIEKGDLWQTPSDWADVLTGLSLPVPDGLELSTHNCQWSLNLPDDVGRLHISLKHKINSVGGAEVLSLELTCRGPINESTGYRVGLELGHVTIVESFTKITSEKAHQIWGLHHE